MKSMEQLEKMYEKEIKLSEQHKKNASDIKKQMEQQMGKTIMQKANALNMTGTEYDRFVKFLGNNKKTVMEAVSMILDKEPESGETPGDTKKAEETQEQSKEAEESESRKETAQD